MEDIPGEFNLLMGDGTREPLRQYEVDYAEKTLGVFVSMEMGIKRQKSKICESRPLPLLIR